MITERLQRATLLRRYKRFLADVELGSGETAVAHCPNPGSMSGIAMPGLPVWLRPAADSLRKLRWTWVISELPESYVVVDALMANRIIALALGTGELPELVYATVERERQFGSSRFDFRLSSAGQHDCFVEVKSTTLAEGEVAMFPDAPTERGRKHLECLVQARRAGFRAVQLFLIARTDTRTFRPANHVDPLYGERLRAAARDGVEVLARAVTVERSGERFCFGVGESVVVLL